MRKLFNHILFFVGLAAIVVMIVAFHVSLSDLLECLSRAGLWLAAIVALWLVIYALNTQAWMEVIPRVGPPSNRRRSNRRHKGTRRFARLWQLTITGYALNSATSIGLVSGEPYRVVELSRYVGPRRATASVALFVMMHTLSHFWFWLTAIATTIVLWAFGWLPLNTATAWVLALATLFCAGGITLFMAGYHKGFVYGLARIVAYIPGLRRVGRKLLDRHGDDLRLIDGYISALRRRRPRNFMRSFWLEYTARLLQSIEIAIILHIFDMPGSWPKLILEGFLIIAFTSLMANLLGFIPMQLGGREGGFALSVASLGMTAPVGVGVGIICRVREIFFDCVGIILLKISEYGTEQSQTDV